MPQIEEVGSSLHAPLVVIVGPTAVGKTVVAIRLAEAFDGEIISADSRQIYRGMTIGTAKPTADELKRVRHHLIDIVDPDQEYHVAQFQQAAYRIIDDLHQRGRVPFLVGGTGQYVYAVLEGWQIPPVPPQPRLREALYQQAQRRGAEYLHGQLAAVDPVAAQRIHPNNVRRVIRALEVYQVSGRPISEWQRKHPPPYRTLRIGLTMKRELLYERIDSRVDQMIADGLEQEVRHLLAQGYTFDLPAMSGLGYGEFKGYFQGTETLTDVVQKIKHNTHRFARHQYNWFSEADSDIQWFDAARIPFSELHTLVKRFLLGTGG